MAVEMINTVNKGAIPMPSGSPSSNHLNKLREDVRKASALVDAAYIQQGIALQQIKDSGIWRTEWLNKTWRDYLEKDACITVQRDRRVRAIAKIFVKRFSIDEKVLVSIGFFNAMTMVPLVKKGIIDEGNVAKWIKLAQESSTTNREMMKISRDAKKMSKALPAPAPISPLELQSAPAAPEVTAAPSASPDHDGGEEADGAAIIQFAPLATAPTPVSSDDNEKVKQTFFFFGGMDKTVDAAIDQASALTGSDSRGFNLELICADFIGSDLTQNSTEEHLAFVLGMIGKTYGYNITYEKIGKGVSGGSEQG